MIVFLKNVTKTSKDVLLNSETQMKKNRQLRLSQRQAIIKLLEEKGRDKTDAKNRD